MGGDLCTWLFSSTPDLDAVDASSTAPAVTGKNISICCQMSPRGETVPAREPPLYLLGKGNPKL